MTEVIESLALNRSKAKLKLETLVNSKDDVEVVRLYLESLIADYTRAINILVAYQNNHNTNEETIKL